jgi:organic hydroperoxide reductase OsmC/OhrA
VTAQIVAKEMGITLASFVFDLAADLDTAVMVGGAADRSGNFERVIVEAVVRTNATPEQFTRLKAETERRCPISQLYIQSGLAYESTWRAEPLA